MNSEAPVFPRSTIPKQIRQARARAAREAGGAVGGNSGRTTKRHYATLDPLPSSEVQAQWTSWFATRGWQPFDYQKSAWQAYAEGQSGLILLPTGSGKTYAALGGPLMQMRETGTDGRGGLRVLYLSPLKALVRDVARAIELPLQKLGWDFRVEVRTGDTDARTKSAQRDILPHLLLTTPESLGLLVTQPGWEDRFRNLQAIVIDEWHELIGSKRGSLLELVLARIRARFPQARTWAISATIADAKLAGQVAVGDNNFRVIEEKLARPVSVRAILPQHESDLRWSGHYGLNRAAEVLAELDPQCTTLLFTNTRGQAERWYTALRELRPDWAEYFGLHHGSLDREERERIENAVKAGQLPFVVATSSLDLGVDFPTVQKVIQIGSIKGVARATQRAGRAFHRPGEATELVVCPTHFLEYLEVAALRRALSQGTIETRSPRPQPLDVLVQFVLSCALGEGFEPQSLLRQIRGAYSYRGVTQSDFDWVLNFITTGGHTLRSYEQFRKVLPDAQGIYRFVTPRLARFHRLNMGTIVGESGVRVRFQRGGTLGQIDEGFITQLKPGDVFAFAGKALELIRLRDLTAYVKLANRKQTVATVWGGNSLPISPALSQPMRDLLAEVAGTPLEASALPPELQVLGGTLAIQRKRSAIPKTGQTLVERIETRDGFHLFVYTWEGRAVNEGLGHLLAYRLTRGTSNTIAVSANDHGFECLGTAAFPDDAALRQALQPGSDLSADIVQSLNYPEMAKRAFREIARVAGLVQVGPPNERASTRHLMMSASLLFDVFRNYDPSHPLLLEAYAELQRSQLELSRLERVLAEIAQGELAITRPDRLTPFAFPLYVDRIRSRLSTEGLGERIARLQAKAFAP